MQTAPMTNPEELRIEILRQRIPLYLLAARVGIHPTRLGAILNGRLPLKADLAARLLRALGLGR